MRSLSLPFVSAVIVSLAGNLIFVFVSPSWTILSSTIIPLVATRLPLTLIPPLESIKPANVETPTTSKPPPVILSPCLAVAIPTESTFLTSS